MPRGPQRKQIPGQLQMLMTPREILGQYSTHIGDRRGVEGYDSNLKTWNKKHVENKASGLTENVKLNGVQFPVGLGTMTDTAAARRAGGLASRAPLTGLPMITGGHHRIEAAFDTAPDQPIPVIHHADILEHQGWNTPESHLDVRSEGATRVQPWGPYR